MAVANGRKEMNGRRGNKGKDAYLEKLVQNQIQLRLKGQTQNIRDT